MEEITGDCLKTRLGQLEDQMALVLGRIQIEFSRLDMNLGLCAVWVEEGRRLEELGPKVDAMAFNKRLEFVEVGIPVQRDR